MSQRFSLTKGKNDWAKILADLQQYQRGRQEFEIGVAYNKVGQKYPNRDIFEASGQKTRRPGDQKTGWSDDWMIG